MAEIGTSRGSGSFQGVAAPRIRRFAAGRDASSAYPTSVVRVTPGRLSIGPSSGHSTA